MSKAGAKPSAKERLLKARTALLLDEPFFGLLAMRLPLLEDLSCDTMWVDGVNMGYNPQFVEGCTDEELKGTICHEVLHVSNGHCWRQGDRDPEDWNKACDYVINPIVRDAGFKLPGNVLMDTRFDGKPAEEVYDVIYKPKPKNGQGQPQGQEGKENQAGSQSSPSGGGGGKDKDSKSKDQPSGSSKGDSKGNGKGADSGKGDDKSKGAGKASDDKNGSKGDKPAGDDGNAQQGGGQGGGGDDSKGSDCPAGEVRPAPKGADTKQLEQEWKQAVDLAAKAAAARGTLPGSLKRAVEDALKPSVDWREVLRMFVQRSWTAADYTWQMPSTRYLPQGLYLPRLASETLPSIVVAIDTSASIWGRLLAAFQAEVAAIADELRPDLTFIVYCDAKVQRVDQFESGEPVEFNHAGGGGTDFRPVFDWVEKEGHQPACLVYLTDLLGAFPDSEPEYPVLWVTPPTRKKAPWGEQVEMQKP